MLLKIGSSGSDVVIMQYGLYILCCDPRGFDGVFGSNTSVAVRTFQSANGLSVDGIVGDMTWNKMKVEILKIQQQLSKKGVKCTEDGLGGVKTLDAIKEFQRKNSLIADGMVGSRTRSVLFSSGGSTDSGSTGGSNSGSTGGSNSGNEVRPLGKKVFLDAGHGGVDPGAVGNGLNEKDITLSITLKVGKILQSKGLDVMYSRTTDVYNAFTQIPSVANRANADLFVSIHCNSFSSLSSSGTECFTAASAGSKTKALAKTVADRLASGLSLVNRGPKEAGYAVLRLSDMPAILIETAFISNAADSQKLRDRQDEFAAIIADCILGYFK